MNKICHTLFLMLCLFSQATAAYAQTTASVYAVLIGIDDYKNNEYITDLRYAVADTKALYNALTNEGKVKKENIKMLLNSEATEAKIKAAVFTWLPSVAKAGDSVVIYFSGHGWAAKRVSYWVTYESTFARNDGEVKLEQGIDLEELRLWVSPPRIDSSITVTLLIDACNSGADSAKFTEKKDFRNALNDKILKKMRDEKEEKNRKGLRGGSKGIDLKSLNLTGRGRVTIASSTQEQYSVEIPELGHGAFTYALIEALKGKADKMPKDGVVTVQELQAYLGTRVSELARRHKGHEQTVVTHGTVVGNVPLSFPGGAALRQASINLTSNKDDATIEVYREKKDGRYESFASYKGVRRQEVRLPAGRYRIVGIGGSVKKEKYVALLEDDSQGIDFDFEGSVDFGKWPHAAMGLGGGIVVVGATVHIMAATGVFGNQFSTINTASNAAYALYAVGGVLVVTGLILYFTNPARSRAQGSASRSFLERPSMAQGVHQKEKSSLLFEGGM